MYIDLDFFIVGHKRSGSTYLCRLLDTHEDIRCLEEIFNPQRNDLPTDILDALGIGRKDVKSRDQDPRAFVSALRDHIGNERLGCKIFMEHTPSVIGALADSNIRRVILNRNYLYSFSSLQAAEDSGDWHDWEGRPPLVKTSKRPVFRSDWFWRFADRIDRFYDLFRQHGPVLEVDYDEVISGDSLPSIAAFLNVPNQFNVEGVGMRRMSQEPLIERYANFDEVVKAVRGSRLEHLLER